MAQRCPPHAPLLPCGPSSAVSLPRTPADPTRPPPAPCFCYPASASPLCCPHHTHSRRRRRRRRRLPLPPGLGLTPPMGWSSWNVFAADIDEEKIKSTIDAMAQLVAAGYECESPNPLAVCPPTPPLLPPPPPARGPLGTCLSAHVRHHPRAANRTAPGGGGAPRVVECSQIRPDASPVAPQT